VVAWTCPNCGRLFDRVNRGHDCAPGLTLEEYFSTGPPHERPIFEAVMRGLSPVGPVHTDIVSVGIFLKNPAKFAELRPMDRWVAISFGLGRVARHRLITRKVIEYGPRFWHVANVPTVDGVDDELIELLAEAYHLVARS